MGTNVVERILFCSVFLPCEVISHVCAFAFSKFMWKALAASVWERESEDGYSYLAFSPSARDRLTCTTEEHVTQASWKATETMAKCWRNVVHEPDTWNQYRPQTRQRMMQQSIFSVRCDTMGYVRHTRCALERTNHVLCKCGVQACCLQYLCVDWDQVCYQFM